MKNSFKNTLEIFLEKTEDLNFIGKILFFWLIPAIFIGQIISNEKEN